MIYETYLYKPNPKKVREDRLGILYIGIYIIVACTIQIIVLHGGLRTVVSVALTTLGFINYKIYDIKKKGANRFGNLPEKLTISPERLTIGDDNIFEMYKLKDVEILLSDYLGEPTDFFGTSAGVGNYINFVRDGVKFSIPFQVKRKGDFEVLTQIENEIIAARKRVLQ